MLQVMKAESHRYGEMGSLGNATNMYIAQYKFPDTYSEKDVISYADSDRCIGWDYEHAMGCIKRHTGTGDQGLGQWAASASPVKIMAFLKEILKVKTVPGPGIRKWTGYRITGTVNRSNGYAVYTLALFAKHPKSATEVYSDAAAPNVGWNEFSRVKESDRHTNDISIFGI